MCGGGGGGIDCGVCALVCTNWLCDMCVYVCACCVCTCAWVKGIWLHDTLYVPVNKYMYM